VHGYGVGGGCALALACDIRVGDGTTRMGIPAAKRGIVYSQIDTELLLRQVGLSRAKLVLYSARVFAAQACREMGLIDILAEAALPAAMAEAAVLAQNAPLSLRGSKLMLEAMAQGRLAESAAAIRAAMAAAVSSEDYQEATSSFMEKRPARFRGV
jgi:enoyl-CoA hydratase/carnithine racemase